MPFDDRQGGVRDGCGGRLRLVALPEAGAVTARIPRTVQGCPDRVVRLRHQPAFTEQGH